VCIYTLLVVIFGPIMSVAASLHWLLDDVFIF